MADPLRLLWPAVEAVRPAFSRAAIVRWRAEDHAALVAAQLILPDGDNPVRIRCPECGRTHICKVVARKQPDGSLRFFIPCPKNLRAEVRQKDLQNWRVNIEQLVSSIGSALSLTGKPKDLANGRVWRCGRTSFGGVLRDVLFARGLRRRDAATFRRAITGSHWPIVFVGTDLPDAEFWQGRVPPLVCLCEIAALADGRIQLDMRLVTGMIRAADEQHEAIISRNQQEQRAVVRRAVNAELKSHLKDEVLVAAYKEYGSYNKAAAGLTEQGYETNRWAVERAVKRAGGIEAVVRGHDSNSVRRTVASQRRDGKKKIDNRPEAVDWE